jgi:hypothetical protein
MLNILDTSRVGQKVKWICRQRVLCKLRQGRAYSHQEPSGKYSLRRILILRDREQCSRLDE